jgi:hypothetical protein
MQWRHISPVKVKGLVGPIWKARKSLRRLAQERGLDEVFREQADDWVSLAHSYM